MLRVLLTNDDGVYAEGIRRLATLLSRHAEVFVVAPDRPSSATSHSITLHKPVRMDAVNELEREQAGNGSLKYFKCSGTPSDCVMLGALHLCADQPPDLLISGINDGLNVAEDLTYSGTVGGALEGAVLGIPSLAVSLEGDNRLSFEESAAITETIVTIMLYDRLPGDSEGFEQASLGMDSEPKLADQWRLPRENMPAGRPYPQPRALSSPPFGETPCFNINIPDRQMADCRGILWTFAGRRKYTDIIRQAKDPQRKPYFWIGGTKVLDDNVPGSDTWAITEGFITVTPITCNITNWQAVDKMGQWLKERKNSPGGQ